MWWILSGYIIFISEWINKNIVLSVLSQHSFAGDHFNITGTKGPAIQGSCDTLYLELFLVATTWNVQSHNFLQFWYHRQGPWPLKPDTGLMLSHDIFLRFNHFLEFFLRPQGCNWLQVCHFIFWYTHIYTHNTTQELSNEKCSKERYNVQIFPFRYSEDNHFSNTSVYSPT